jgi:tetratricopeptide (TPR) repeat protein
LGIGKDQEALEWLDKALEIYIEKPLEVDVDRNQIQLMNNKAATLATQGKYQDALTWINLTLKIDPGNALALGIKGIIFSILGQEEEGLTMINKALEMEPNNTRVLELKKDLDEYMK